MKKWETCNIPSRSNPGKTCGNTGRMPFGDLSVCRRHLRQLEKATPLESWVLTQGIACPQHPRGKLEQQDDRMVCRTRVRGGGFNAAVRLCSFSTELPEHLGGSKRRRRRLHEPGNPEGPGGQRETP